MGFPRCLAATALPLLVVVAPRPAAAQADPSCRVVEMEMTPSEGLQIVAWLEDTDGNYVETVYITRTTGTYGLGNRPGIMEFNSGPLWPYGRRVTTFPVWAARHGMTFPLVLFQDEDDDNIEDRLHLLIHWDQRVDQIERHAHDDEDEHERDD